MPVRLVSSANITSAVSRASFSREDTSPRLPIGVAHRMRVPDITTWYGDNPHPYPWRLDGRRQLENPPRLIPAADPSRRNDSLCLDDAICREEDHTDRAIQSERVNRLRPQQNRRSGWKTNSEKSASETTKHNDATYVTAVPVEIQTQIHHLRWYASITMAKAKRRKLRARRSKANHGRKPNAGRG